MTPPNEFRKELLFIDASDMGRMVTRTHRELGAEEIHEMGAVVARWRRGEELDSALAMSVSLGNVRGQDYNLNPRKYVVPPPADVSGDKQMVEDLWGKLGRLHARAAEAIVSPCPGLAAVPHEGRGPWREVR
ncbi:N-6 DNA methylase [Streptosporangium sp. NBC_01755]|uniref:N-6 DNA methylase n=1 Tax=Streptosporangium sp. NBC_01755 TaxID=2975949 RepID=UPI002DD88586|nr:N-6 DNA methylase [Streptosporangium sp. NBC_01755]WSA29685.1 N-6 DNA methylase [Streptosporangium sp. NBC_01810]WSD04172.1 N-6 DNA methylase [Streptosporangium sp. NBC_01755]